LRRLLLLVVGQRKQGLDGLRLLAGIIRLSRPIASCQRRAQRFAKRCGRVKNRFDVAQSVALYDARYFRKVGIRSKVYSLIEIRPHLVELSRENEHLAAVRCAQVALQCPPSNARDDHDEKSAARDRQRAPTKEAV
jgi:hypothetical protein